MDATKPENKAKANEKAELTIVSEHFEAVFRRTLHLKNIVEGKPPLSGFVAFMH